MVERMPRRLFLAVLLVALASCAVPPETVEPQADAPPLDWLTAPGESVPLDTAASRIDIRVYRAGRLASLGHNHAIEVTGLEGRLWRLGDGGGLADLRIRPDRLRVDDAAARARAGPAFEQMPDARAIAGTRRNMLGEQVLDAANWPEIRVLARVPTLAVGSTNAEVYFSLRGNGRLMTVPVRIEQDTRRLRVSGNVSLQQSAFGITPFSVFGGALAVRDTVELEFVIGGG